MTQPLPQMPEPKTFKGWAERWLNDKYPAAKTDKPAAEIRDEMYDDIPRKFLPSFDDLLRSWFTGAVQGVFRTVSPRRSFLDAPTGNGKVERVVVQLALLDLDDFRRVEVKKLALANGDVAAVAREVTDYATAHPDRITSVATFMSDLRKAAGLD